MPTTRPRRLLLLGLGILLGVLAGAAPAARGAGTAKPATKFAEVAGAWQAGSADRVAGCMEPRHAVSFRLLAYPLSGKTRSMRPEQAAATLKAYFKRIGGIGLKDVTPRQSPENVRLYDYTYKPAGEGERTTRLHVQLKQDGDRRWVLASVTESSKPRS